MSFVLQFSFSVSEKNQLNLKFENENSKYAKYEKK